MIIACYNKSKTGFSPFTMSRDSQTIIKHYYREHSDDYDRIMLDSGAFSMWNKEDPKPINLDLYCAYCLAWLDKIKYFVNLDVIPGRPKQRNIPTKEYERSAKEGYKNYETMLAAGIPKKKLIHVFHQGEDIQVLKQMVKDMDYIGLSPAKTTATPIKKREWLASLYGTCLR